MKTTFTYVGSNEYTTIALTNAELKIVKNGSVTISTLRKDWDLIKTLPDDIIVECAGWGSIRCAKVDSNSQFICDEKDTGNLPTCVSENSTVSCSNGFMYKYENGVWNKYKQEASGEQVLGITSGVIYGGYSDASDDLVKVGGD